MQSDNGKLFVGGISWDTNEERLKEYFGSFGDVVEAVIMKDRTTGRARGFGFVVFADPTVADEVIKEKHSIDGRMVEAKKAIPRDDQNIPVRTIGPTLHGSPGPGHSRKIFVGGLASTVTESDFKNYFDQFGTITDVVVMYDHNTQRPRGFGFITYDSEEAVDKVLTKTFHELNGKMVEVKRAVPKELSPGPTRTPLGGYDYGFNRFNSFFSGGGYGLRMEGRYSPVNVGLSGFSPVGSGHGMGLNLEPSLSPTYGNLGFARGVNPYVNRFSSPIGYDGGNSSFFSSATRNLWGNGGVNYGMMNSNAGSFGNGVNWGTSPLVSRGNENGNGNAILPNDLALRYVGENAFGLEEAPAFRRNSTGGLGQGSSLNSSSGTFEGSFPEFYGGSGSGDYNDRTWRPLTSGQDEIDPFTYDIGNDNVSLDTSPGYIGGYVNKRQSSRGIAA